MGRKENAAVKSGLALFFAVVAVSGGVDGNGEKTFSHVSKVGRVKRGRERGEKCQEG